MANLLLVDDNTQLLGLYKLVLEGAGHQVFIADNRAGAVGLLHETGPEIVIMDLRMPEMEDGLSLIRSVKDHTPADRAAPARIVVISGWAEDLLDTPEKAHVARVLSKPVRIEVLLRVISELVATCPRV
jgi:CheY-like chemotaxis protein